MEWEGCPPLPLIPAVTTFLQDVRLGGARRPSQNHAKQAVTAGKGKFLCEPSQGSLWDRFALVDLGSVTLLDFPLLPQVCLSVPAVQEEVRFRGI